MGIVVYRGCYIGLFTLLKPFLPEDNPAAAAILGFGLTVFSGLVSYPMDTVRRRMLVSENTSGKSATDFAREIFQTEGMSGLMSGAGVSVVSGVAWMAAIMAYKAAKGR